MDDETPCRAGFDATRVIDMQKNSSLSASRHHIIRRMKTRATASELLGSVIEPLGRCLTPAAAKEILSLHADEQAHRRVEELAAKSDSGALSPEERAEYQLFVEVGDLVALLQAKARRYLIEHPA